MASLCEYFLYAVTEKFRGDCVFAVAVYDQVFIGITITQYLISILRSITFTKRNHVHIRIRLCALETHSAKIQNVARFSDPVPRDILFTK